MSNQNCTKIGELVYVAGWLVEELERVRLLMAVETRGWLDEAIDKAADLNAGLENHRVEMNDISDLIRKFRQEK